MASKFLIDIRRSSSPNRPPKVRVVDDSLDESTGWKSIPKRYQDASDEVILAVASQQSPSIREMLETASSVAYAVYVNEDDFDLHGFLPRVSSIVAKADMELNLKASTDRMRRRM